MFANTAEAQAVVDRMQAYGVQATGEVVTAEYHKQVTAEPMTLSEIAARGGRISRVRILKEYGRCDISYIHATLADGTIVPVNMCWMPSSGIGLWFREVKGEFIAWAKAEGVYAKGLGLLDEGNWAVLG